MARFSLTQVRALPLLSKVQSPAIEQTKTAPRFHLGYRPALDGMRALAIFGVMLVHTDPIQLSGGAFGVDVFFVLSGFLITSILLEEWDTTGAISLKRFYLRRVLRLYPAMVTLVFVFALLHLTALRTGYGEVVFAYRQHPDDAWRAMIAALFYFANWAWGSGWVHLGPVEHTWSLSIEEQFYVLWPTMLLLMLRFVRTRILILAMIVVGIAISMHWRYQVYSASPSWVRPYAGLDTRADALLIGCGLGVIATANWLPTSRWAQRTFALLAIAAAVTLGWFVKHAAANDPSLYKGGFTIVALSAAVIIGYLLVSPTGIGVRLLSITGLVRIGRISYGMYLWHYPIWRIVQQQRLPTIKSVPLQFVLSVTVATLSYILIEKRFLRLKSRFAVKLAPKVQPVEAAVPAGRRYSSAESVGP
ncbi:MAG TPA: acyltransferase [Thermomicrobiales bacterium]|nr:acyltransferase [Thermomicrobiales bacterium]